MRKSTIDAHGCTQKEWKTRIKLTVSCPSRVSCSPVPTSHTRTPPSAHPDANLPSGSTARHQTVSGCSRVICSPGLPQIEETVREFLETICQKCGPKPGANSTRDSGSSNSSSSSRCSSSSSCSSTIGSLASCCSISSCCAVAAKTRKQT